MVVQLYLIPIDDEGNILFVRQYRHAAGKDLLELPAGTRDGDEPYEECAAREIREETGMEAGKLRKVGEFYLAPGYSTEFMAVFLATELKHNPLDADEDEFFQVERIPVKESIRNGRAGNCQMPNHWRHCCWQNPIWRNILVNSMMILIAGLIVQALVTIPKRWLQMSITWNLMPCPFFV